MLRRPIPRAFPLELAGVPFATLAYLNGITPRWARRLRASTSEGVPAGAAPTQEEAVTMAQLRAPKGHLSYWSRLAMKHYRDQGLTNREIAELFKVCLNTVVRVMKLPGRGYAPLTGTRLLSSAQRRVTEIGKNSRECP
jgi:hypothetical protein